MGSAKKLQLDSLFRQALESAVVAETPGEMLQTLFEVLRTQLPLTACIEYVTDGADGMLRMAHHIGLPDGLAERVSWLAIEASALGRPVRERRTLLLDSDAIAADPVLVAIRDANIGKLIGHPLGIDDRLVGVLVFATPQDAVIDPSDLEFLDRISRWVALGLERLQTREILAEEQSSLKRLTNALPDLVAYIDAEERLQFTNEAYRRWLGLDPPLLEGRHVAEVIGRRAYARSADALRRALAGESLSYGDHLPLPSGDLPVLIRLVPDVSRSGRIRGCFCAIADVSQLERIQSELRAQTERLERMDRRKDEFLAVLGHELRNPLQAIDHGLRLLEEALDATERKRVQRMMRHQLDQLVSLLEDLLDLTRIARGKIKLDKASTDVVNVIRRAVAAAQKTMAGKQHELTVRVPPSLEIEADATRVEQILVNLLQNAVKFTPVGGHIEVRARREGDVAVLAVKDDGEGLTQDVREHIFDAFSQADPARGGLGIGLALVNRLVSLHDGSISVSSEGPGRGSEFTVRLPVGFPETCGKAAEPSLQLPTGCNAFRILVVDDNEDAAESLALLLRRRGCDVETVNTGSAVFEAVHRQHPHLVLLDIGLPDMDGFEVAEALRADPESAPISLVAITGFGDEGTKRRAHDVGFDARLVKPIDPDLVIRMLHEAEHPPQDERRAAGAPEM